MFLCSCIALVLWAFLSPPLASGGSQPQEGRSRGMAQRLKELSQFFTKQHIWKYMSCVPLPVGRGRDESFAVSEAGSLRRLAHRPWISALLQDSARAFLLRLALAGHRPTRSAALFAVLRLQPARSGPRAVQPFRHGSSAGHRRGVLGPAAGYHAVYDAAGRSRERHQTLSLPGYHEPLPVMLTEAWLRALQAI